jgi:hypothetical protein
VDLRDVQIAARHADPRTTMRHDRARKNLDRHPQLHPRRLHGIGHLIRSCITYAATRKPGFAEMSAVPLGRAGGRACGGRDRHGWRLRWSYRA